jgi:TPR repeat protein
MDAASTTTADSAPVTSALLAEDGRRAGARRWIRFPYVPLGLAALLAGFVLLPPVSEHAGLRWSFLGASGFLALWTAILSAVARLRGRVFGIDFAPPQKSHYVQGCVQTCIYTYWGWYWPKVYESVPLILAQLVFLLAFEGLLTWSRGRSWRMGFGPMPIVLSVNLFLWFKDDWFALQFAMLASCALGKEFIRWQRDGKSSHIFNPSAFGLALVSAVLIATGTTRLTWGIEVATTLGYPPHIYLLIFALGLVVQYFFSVTLMTLAAVAVLVACNLVYTRVTGVYHFVDTNLPIAIFLGLHLLVTDPATSPRTNAGRVIFGALYGLANFVLFTTLGAYGVPDFYDKLLPVPILNLMVPALDRFARSAPLARLRRWEESFRPRTLNYAHMGCWIVLFAWMWTSGFVEAQHEGNSLAFWKEAYEQGKPAAARNYMKMAGSLSEKGDPVAQNELGEIYLAGAITPQNLGAATFYFAQSAARGYRPGSENVAGMYAAHSLGVSGEAVRGAFDVLEHTLGQSPDGRDAYLLGWAFESGQVRNADPRRALELYAMASQRGNLEACFGIARVYTPKLEGVVPRSLVAQALDQACGAEDAQACAVLSELVASGTGVAADADRSASLLQRARELQKAGARERVANSAANAPATTVADPH